LRDCKGSARKPRLPFEATVERGVRRWAEPGDCDQGIRGVRPVSWSGSPGSAPQSPGQRSWSTKVLGRYPASMPACRLSRRVSSCMREVDGTGREEEAMPGRGRPGDDRGHRRPRDLRSDPGRARRGRRFALAARPGHPRPEGAAGRGGAGAACLRPHRQDDLPDRPRPPRSRRAGAAGHPNLRPWRLGPFICGSRVVVELPAGTAAATRTQPGDIIELGTTPNA
jgi:hypothetical protein